LIKTKEFIMSITNKETTTILDDGETWSGTGYVAVFGSKEKREFLHAREFDEDLPEDTSPVDKMTDSELDYWFWEELNGDKAIRDLDVVCEVYETDRLMKFYLMSRELGLDKIVWETLDGVEAASK
jgi:hypothetical protein